MMMMTSEVAKHKGCRRGLYNIEQRLKIEYLTKYVFNCRTQNIYLYIFTLLPLERTVESSVRG